MSDSPAYQPAPQAPAGASAPVPGKTLGIVALIAHGVAAPGEGVALTVGMAQVEHAALAHHDIVIEFLLQPLPETKRMAVELGIARQAVIGAHDGGV